MKPLLHRIILHMVLMSTKQLWISGKGCGVLLGLPIFRCDQDHLAIIVQTFVKMPLLFVGTRELFCTIKLASMFLGIFIICGRVELASGAWQRLVDHERIRTVDDFQCFEFPSEL